MNVSHNARTLVSEKWTALLGVHAFTGCDSVQSAAEESLLVSNYWKMGIWQMDLKIWDRNENISRAICSPAGIHMQTICTKVKCLPSQWSLIPAVQSKEGRCWIWPTSTLWRHSVPPCCDKWGTTVPLFIQCHFIFKVCTISLRFFILFYLNFKESYR